MLATPDRDRILTIMRHKNHGMAQIRHMIALLKEAAGLIPDFQSVCADSCVRRGTATALPDEFHKAANCTIAAEHGSVCSANSRRCTASPKTCAFAPLTAAASMCANLSPNWIAATQGAHWSCARESSAFMRMNSKGWQCARTSASALLKRPKILIFDEATSNLDADTSEKFAATVNKLKGKVSMIFIAHQLPKTLQVDRVVNLNADTSSN